MVIGEFFSRKKLHKFINIQYVAVKQNIHTILYDYTMFYCPMYGKKCCLLTWMLTSTKFLRVQFSTAVSTVFIFNTHRHKQVFKRRGSSSEHYL